MKTLLLFGAIALSVNVFAQVPNYVPTNGLVGWWGFNGNANDESGNGNNGTVNGATLIADRFGNANSAYDFDGTGNEIIVNDNINLDGVNEFSISIWVNLDVINGGGGGAGLIPLVSKWATDANNPNSSYILSLQPQLCWSIDSQQNPANYGLYQAVHPNGLSAQSWHHIVAQNTLNYLELYLNGVLVASTNQVNEGIGNNNTLLRFGTWYNSFNSSFSSTDGRLDDIGIWNRALTQCEISALYYSLPQNGTDIQSACDSYTWVDGNTYTTSNNSATYTTSNAAGCDSTVTLDLTITNSTSSTDIQSACDSYTWVDGNTYTTSNNSATYTTSNAAGCDSTVTLNLTINPTPDNSITQNGASLTATQTGATYQWIDCDNFNAPIIGEVNQTFFPSLSGNYAVEVTIGDCSSTSECRLVDFTGIDEIESLISVHPNPTKDEVTLSIGAELLGTEFVVTDNAGRIILTDTFKSSKQIVNLTRFDNGVYFIRTDKESPVKIIKQ